LGWIGLQDFQDSLTLLRPLRKPSACPLSKAGEPLRAITPAALPPALLLTGTPPSLTNSDRQSVGDVRRWGLRCHARTIHGFQIRLCGEYHQQKRAIGWQELARAPVGLLVCVLRSKQGIELFP